MALLCPVPAGRPAWTEKATPFSLHMLLILTIGMCWTFSKPALATTVFVNAVECFASIYSPIAAAGIVVSGRSSSRESICFLTPAEGYSFVSLRVDRLDLFGDCSTLRVSEYKLPSRTFLQNEKNNSMVNMTRFRAPERAYLLAEASCKNPESMANRVLSTSDAGYGLMLEFKPYPSQDQSSFEVTVTAYEPAPTGKCPEHLFQCSSVQPKCISPKLTCDLTDNCFNGYDERFFLCSHVGNVPSVLVIVLCVSALAVIIAATVLLCVVLPLQPLKGTPVDIQMNEIPRHNPEAAPLTDRQTRH